MTIDEKREKIEQYAASELKKEFGDETFDLFALNDLCSVEHKLMHDKFSFLYTHNKKTRTYLWNIVYGFRFTAVDKISFSKTERAFLRRIKKCNDSNIQEESRYINVNDNIVTRQIVLKAVNRQTDKVYNEFFENNPQEFENFYEVEYSESAVRCFAQQKEVPLSFAAFSNSGEYVGNIALYCLSKYNYDIEYFVFPKYRKRGYASEMFLALTQRIRERELVSKICTLRDGVFTKKKENIKNIIAIINKENLKSINFAKKMGFVECFDIESIADDFMVQRANDGHHVAYVYSL